MGGTPRVPKTGKRLSRRVSFAYEDQMGCNDAAHAVARTESQNWARATFSKLKNHCQNRPKFAPNFGDIPYVVYCDLRTAAAFNRSVMKLLNSSGRGRLTLCDLSERGPSSGCCRKQAFRGVSGGRSGDALNLCGTSPKLQKGLNTL